jgi:hypothetical protein
MLSLNPRRIFQEVRYATNCTDLAGWLSCGGGEEGRYLIHKLVPVWTDRPWWAEWKRNAASHCAEFVDTTEKIVFPVRVATLFVWHVLRALVVAGQQVVCRHPTPVFKTSIAGEAGPIVVKVCLRCEKIFAEAQRPARKVGA